MGLNLEKKDYDDNKKTMNDEEDSNYLIGPLFNPEALVRIM